MGFCLSLGMCVFVEACLQQLNLCSNLKTNKKSMSTSRSFWFISMQHGCIFYCFDDATNGPWSIFYLIFLNSVSLIVLALWNCPNPFRNPHTESHWLCRHYWRHHWPALDPSELYCRYNLPNNDSSLRPELGIFSRCGGGICWLLHDSRFGARRGLWDQYLRCYRRWRKQADHTHKANTCWWLISFT